MRLNKFIASSSSLSRRKADQAILDGRVTVNGAPASQGLVVTVSDTIQLDGVTLVPPTSTATIMLHKPVGYVVSRDGQGSHTIYDLITPQYQQLEPVGRLDKNTSGLLLLSNDGQLTQALTHPSHHKDKLYEVTLYKPLSKDDWQRIIMHKVDIGDKRPSGFSLRPLSNLNPMDTHEIETNSFAENCVHWQIIIQEGRNRQIRRTFETLMYGVKTLHRTKFGDYELSTIAPGQISILSEV